MSAKPPVYSPSPSSGNPATIPPRPMPNSSGSAPLPSVVAHLQAPRQRADATFSPNSNEAPRAISATSTSSSARYRPENSVAYQAGKAANIAAPATISQTSLPSQNGPIAFRAVWRSRSSRPTIVCSMPTPKSKPSRTKNPVQKKATTMNQKVSSDMSVGQGGDGLARLGLVGQAAPGVAEHQHELRDTERDVQEREDDEADHDLGRADRRRDAVRGLHQPLHDPRLAAVLGQHPARRVHDERGEHRPDGGAQEPLGRRELAPVHQPRAPQRQCRDHGGEVGHHAHRPVLDEDVRNVVP